MHLRREYACVLGKNIIASCQGVISCNKFELRSNLVATIFNSANSSFSLVVL